MSALWSALSPVIKLILDSIIGTIWESRNDAIEADDIDDNAGADLFDRDIM